MDAAFALEVFDKAPFVTVSMVRPDGTPYGLPLSLVRTDERTFYFHCAMEGDKLDCISHCPTVFLSAVSRCTPTVGPKDGSFTLQYKSPQRESYSHASHLPAVPAPPHGCFRRCHQSQPGTDSRGEDYPVGTTDRKTQAI